MNPFEEKPQKIEKSFQSWKNVLVKPYDKQTVDPYTRLRVILMNGTEFESVRLGHSYTRNCTNNDIRRELALIRRSEQFQQKRDRFAQAHGRKYSRTHHRLRTAGGGFDCEPRKNGEKRLRPSAAQFCSA